MDDLLIVRSSERIRSRNAYRHSRGAFGGSMGAALGIIMAVCAAVAFKSGVFDAISFGQALAILAAVGLVLGLAAGFAYRPRKTFKSVHPERHYDGMPGGSADSDNTTTTA